MKILSFALLATILLAVLIPSVRAAGDTKVQESMIVSTEWLTKHLNDDSLVLLQVGEKAE